MALRVSCLIHGLAFLLLVGCAAHRPVPVPVLPDAEISEAKDFVVAVADKMPLWDADAISRYELVEIATVKADIAMAKQTEEKGSVPRLRGQVARRLGCISRTRRDAKEGVAYVNSKQWLEHAIKKPAKKDQEETTATASKRARLAEALLNMRKEKG